MTDIKTFIEETFTDITTTSELTSVSDIGEAIIARLGTGEYREALFVIMPKYVQHLMALSRQITPLVPENEFERFAPDDLLSDDVADIVEASGKKMLIARGSARVNAIRTSWQTHFTDRVWNGTEYKIFGDFTAVDLKGAADSLRSQAASFTGKASRYETIAAALRDGQTVSSLTNDPTGV